MLTLSSALHLPYSGAYFARGNEKDYRLLVPHVSPNFCVHLIYIYIYIYIYKIPRSTRHTSCLPKHKTERGSRNDVGASCITPRVTYVIKENYTTRGLIPTLAPLLSPPPPPPSTPRTAVPHVGGPLRRGPEVKLRFRSPSTRK